MLSNIACFVLLLPVFAATIASAQSVRDLDFLIGEWDVTETILPGSENEYRETGVRSCAYYLDDSFIKCEAQTVVSTSGKKRTYAYLVNYDSRNGWFSATGIANDFPLHSNHRWFLDEDRKKITFVTPRNVNDDQFFRGTIEYDGKDTIVWQGWSSRFEGDKEWRWIFRDVATRRQNQT